MTSVRIVRNSDGRVATIKDKGDGRGVLVNVEGFIGLVPLEDCELILPAAKGWLWI